MQYRPTAAELLREIADLLENEVVDALGGPVQHKVRVAANLARILEQEVQRAPGNAERERAASLRLLGLAPEDPTPLADLRARLAQALRTGVGLAPDVDDAAAWEALVAITRDDLAIAKPGHDSWTGDA